MKEVTAALPFQPYPHQREAHGFLGLFRFLVLVWHRRGGKTVFAVVELVLAALRCTLERGRFAYLAPFQKQAKAVAWDYLRHFAGVIPGAEFNESELAVTFPNGARIRLYGADNPDAMRGLYLDGVVMDEVADMRPSVWGEIVRPALADRQGWACFIGTPKGVNLFSELYYSALRGLSGWKADLRRASETGVIPPEELALAKQTMTPAQYAQEWDCDFAAAVDNILCTLDSIIAAMDRTLAESAWRYAPRVLGVDCARYGDDLSVIQPRQGLMAFQPQKHAGLNTMELAGQVAQVIDRWQAHATMVDVGGQPGGGVVDRLRELGYPIQSVDFGGKPLNERFENKRAEMWWDMSEWVKQGCLPRHQRLQADLSAPTYTYKNARGRLQLESKDDMRGRGLPSPDFGDALACTFAFPVAQPSDWEEVQKAHGMRPQQRGRALTEFDPYAMERP